MPVEVSDDLRDAAILALEIDAGCESERAGALVNAVETAVAVEAIEVIAGKAQIFGSALDRRVAMLDRVVKAIKATERMPTDFEVGAIFQITPTQGRNVLRTYQARYSESYRSHLQRAVQRVTPESKSQDGVKVFVFDFDDPAVLEFAVERLRRRGLSRSVTVDRTKLDLIVNQDEKDRLGKTAKEALKEG